MAEENLKSQAKSGLYWKAIEMFSKYGINFVISILMARMLDPHDYGVAALPALFMVLMTIFTDSGFTPALIRKPELTESDLTTAFFYSLTIGSLCYIILYVAAPYIADFYVEPELTGVLRFTALGGILAVLGMPLSVKLQRSLNFKQLSMASVVGRLIAALIGLYLAYIGLGVWALVITTMLGVLFTFIINYIHLPWRPKGGVSKESFRYLWGYGNKMFVTEILTTLFDNVKPVFIGKYYSVRDLGIYNKAEGYAQLPSSSIFGIVHGLTFPILSKMQDDDERLRYNYRRMLRILAFILFPLMMGLAVLSRPFVVLLLSSKWEECVPILQILCFSTMWLPIHQLNRNLLMVKGRSDYFFKLEMIKKVWELFMLMISLPFGIIYFCAASILVNIVNLFINTYYTDKLLQLGFVAQMKDYYPFLLLSGAMALLVFGINLLIPSMLLQLIVGVVVGVVFYIGAAYLLKMEVLNDVKYLLHR